MTTNANFDTCYVPLKEYIYCACVAISISIFIQKCFSNFIHSSVRRFIQELFSLHRTTPPHRPEGSMDVILVLANINGVHLG